MNALQLQLQKAGKSRWQLWVLNWKLWLMVPFNRPHRIRITTVTAESLTIEAPNIHANRNHIRGVHACVLATLCEYVSGLSILARLPPEEYRIILKSLQMTYHYQAKTAVTATFSLPSHTVEQEILLPLRTEEKIFREFTVSVHDTDHNLICTGLINWQIKNWKHVRTRPV